VSIDYQLGDPDKTLGELELTAKDKKIIKKGDVRAMFDMGVHPFLLNHLSRHQLFGLGRENYLPRMRGEQKPAD
jgi:hypothetical protein